MQKKKGISLIVLVITIIVMIILAGSIILTLSNSGIINKANEAVGSTNEAQIQEMATTELILNGWYAGKPFEANDVDNVAAKLGAKVEQYGNDTLILEKDGTKVIMYASGDTLQGEIWDGTSKESPEIDKDGNWHIYNAAQFKFFADFVNGEITDAAKIISETTVVYLEANIDMGARWETDNNNNDTDKNKTGDRFDKHENIPLTITENADNNIKNIVIFIIFS